MLKKLTEKQENIYTDFDLKMKIPEQRSKDFFSIFQTNITKSNIRNLLVRNRYRRDVLLWFTFC